MAFGSTRKGEDSPVVAQNEYAQGRPRRGGGFRRHCARCWWLYLIVLIIFILLVVLLVIFVGIPHIAQSKINDAVLTIQGIAVRNTQTQNFTMSINSTITSDGSVHATIDSFLGDLYLEDYLPHTPFAKVQFPQTNSDALVIVNITDQFINIDNLEAFTIFNTWLLENDTFRVTVSGDTNVQVSGISHAFPITFTKTVTLPGLRGLVGTNVTQPNITVVPDANGNDFSGFVQIPNYSLVTFEIGNASFHNYLNGQEVGTSFINDLILVAGQTNNYSMAANITEAPVLTALQQKPYCTNGGVLPLQLRGKTVVNHGQPLSYFADALGSANQTMQIPVGEALKNMNVTLSCSS